MSNLFRCDDAFFFTLRGGRGFALHLLLPAAALVSALSVVALGAILLLCRGEHRRAAAREAWGQAGCWGQVLVGGVAYLSPRSRVFCLAFSWLSSVHRQTWTLCAWADPTGSDTQETMLTLVTRPLVVHSVRPSSFFFP